MRLHHLSVVFLVVCLLVSLVQASPLPQQRDLLSPPNVNSPFVMPTVPQLPPLHSLPNFSNLPRRRNINNDAATNFLTSPTLQNMPHRFRPAEFQTSPNSSPGRNFDNAERSVQSLPSPSNHVDLQDSASTFHQPASPTYLPRSTASNADDLGNRAIFSFSGQCAEGQAITRNGCRTLYSRAAPREFRLIFA